MKIDETKLKELKQSYRIEYRQRLEVIQRRYSGGLKILFPLLILWSIFATGTIISGDVALLKLSQSLARIIPWAFFFEIFFFIFNIVYLSKKEKELNEEYFSSKVEVKNK